MDFLAYIDSLPQHLARRPEYSEKPITATEIRKTTVGCMVTAYFVRMVCPMSFYLYITDLLEDLLTEIGHNLRQIGNILSSK